MTNLIRAELLKLRTTQVWFWLLLGAVAVSVLLVVARLAGGGVSTAADVPDLFTGSATAYLVVFVLGVLGVTTEFRYQTITATLLITPSRWAVVAAKMIAYAIVGAGYALVCVVAQLVVAVPWLEIKNISFDLGDGAVWHALLAVFGVVALFGIVGLGVGALLRNQIVAIVVGLLFLLVLENVLLAIPKVRVVWPYMPGSAAGAILHTTGDRNVTDGVSLLPVAGGVVVLLLWAFVPAILGAGLTMNRDIT